MQKQQFINLIESINNIVEARRGYGYGYGGEEYATFPTEAEYPSGGYDDPAAVASGMFGSRPQTPSQVHTPAKQTITPAAPKEMGASGKQLSMASFMPHSANPMDAKVDEVITGNLHGLSPEAHAQSVKMLKGISVNSPETIRNLGRFLVKQGVDPAHPHVQKLFRSADFHDQMNDERYSRY